MRINSLAYEQKCKLLEDHSRNKANALSVAQKYINIWSKLDPKLEK